MKYLSLFVLAILVPAGSFAEGFPRADFSKLPKGATMFRIAKDGKVSVQGKLIKEVELSGRSAVVRYLNKSDQLLAKPNFQFRVFDAYGIEISSFRDEWTFSTIEPGGSHEEELQTLEEPLERRFEFSGINFPADWKIPAYLLIEGMKP